MGNTWTENKNNNNTIAVRRRGGGGFTWDARGRFNEQLTGRNECEKSGKVENF